MSEPVSNAEIEDVLSSIRRLVSNDVEAFQQEIVAEPTKVEPAAKLILTPAFRVVAPQDAQTDSTKDDAAVEDDGDFVATDEAIDEAPNGVPATEMATEMTAETLAFRHTEQTLDVETDADTNLEAAFGAEFEADPADQAQNANVENEPDATAPEEDVVSVSGLEGTIAELEAAIGQQDGEWEPDGSGFEEDAEAEEVMSEPVQDWIDGTAKDLDAETEVATATGDNDEDPDLFGAQETVIDEEALRDMVSDIVRQELQGALGERITRNVRKLVRREINRVLAAQDFD